MKTEIAKTFLIFGVILAFLSIPVGYLISVSYLVIMSVSGIGLIGAASIILADIWGVSK